MGYFSPEVSENAFEDALTLGAVVNSDENAIVESRLGATYPSLAKALYTVIQSGGFEPFTTEAALLASVPTVPKKAAKALDTKKVWYWNGSAWVDTGLSELDQAKNYADQKAASKIEGVLGKNLFDKSKAISGKGLSDTGTVITAAGRNVSDYIAVSPSAVYSFSGTTKVIFYDASKAFVQLSAGATANVTSAATAAFVRIDVADASLNTAQMELGAAKTSYAAYSLEAQTNSVGNSALKVNSVSADKLQAGSVIAKHFKNAVFLNMHDASKLRVGISIALGDGVTETVNASRDVTDYMSILPNTAYVCNELSRVFFYTASGSFIESSANSSFTTPANAALMRFMLSSATSYRFQVNIGTVLPAIIPQPYSYYLSDMAYPKPTKIEAAAIMARKYSFADAWYAWRNNEKFPIAFLGDSTTNGNGTTGFAYRDAAASLGQDYIAPNSYTSVFQALIREITGNNVMRAYNAGFSGRNATYALANMDAIFGEAYADVKMIGISMGINDRTTSASLYARNFYRDIEGIIQWCFNKGIQPFLLTCQPVTIPQFTGEGSGSDIQEVANEIKKNLAAKYDLELVDVSKFGEQFMQYSTKPLLNNIMQAGSNVIHFGDGGHKFTAELLFANFCKRCIWTTQGEQLDYATQLMFSNIEHTQIMQITPFKQGFKVELSTTQATAGNKLLQEFWVFNAGRKQLNLTAYFANAAVGQYAVVDGVQTTITTQGQALGTLDLGLHKIKAYSSATTQLDWLGFKLIPTA